MLRPSSPLKWLLVYLVTCTHGEHLMLSEGIYKNRYPIVGLGDLKSIELDAKDSERGKHGKVKLKMSAASADYDLVLSMSDHFEMFHTPACTYLEPERRRLRDCLRFAQSTVAGRSGLAEFLNTLYTELKIPFESGMNWLNNIHVCLREGRWTAYLGRRPSSGRNMLQLLYPVELSLTESSSMSRTREPMPSSPFSREPITLERLYVPRPGILEASDGQVFVSITGTSIDQRLAELILAFNTVSPPTVPIINDHYMKYAYRDARYPSDSMTGLSLPPVPLLHYKATSEVGRFPTTNRICWRLHVLDDDDDLRDFVETAAEGLKLPELNVSNILLCYVSSEWQLRLGPIHKAIRLRYDEKRCDSEVLMEATPYEAGPPSNMPRLDLL